MIRSLVLAALSAALLAACAGADPDPTGPCVPACAGRACGDDGCGGSCGTCAAGTACDAAFRCAAVCTPDCSGRSCGDDGCGGSCGTCLPGTSCDATFHCASETCAPACAGRQCGDDGCGGSCGTCGLGLACGVDRACASLSCGGGQACLLAHHSSYAYACTRSSEASPWICVQGSSTGWHASATECRMACAGGESACHEGDTDVGEACRRCYASCAPYDTTACDGEAPGDCPWPCACR